MTSNGLSTEPCLSGTPIPARKRTTSYTPVSNLSSAKRRRISMVWNETDMGLDYEGEKTLQPINSVDRFVPSRPKNNIPLNVTPRTNRISRQFGLTDNRVFNFKDNQENMIMGRDETSMFGLLRRSVSSLFHNPPRSRPTSVTENLHKRQQCVLTLDGPGISTDPHACPITWSKRNLIAVSCGNDVFYQNLSTRMVAHLCRLEVSSPGELRTIEWAGEGREGILALGSSSGIVQIWDAHRDGGPGTMMRMWRECQSTGVGGLHWHDNVLAVGSYDGSISLFDIRTKSEARRVSVHKGRVLGLKWNMDGSLLASGDHLGVVYIWDKRAGKKLLDDSTKSARMRHRGPVKALAWCPWKPDLLASGSAFPEGKIHIWSSSPSFSPDPLETLPLNTSVLSLHWSPHCKELLSTHGTSFEPLPISTRASTLPRLPRPQLKPVASPLTNSIAVHEYPSGKRLLTLMAHLGPVTHSCLGPDGQKLFTVSPKEETIKLWHVWSKRVEVNKKESAFDKCTIR